LGVEVEVLDLPIIIIIIIKLKTSIFKGATCWYYCFFFCFVFLRKGKLSRVFESFLIFMTPSSFFAAEIRDGVGSVNTESDKNGKQRSEIAVYIFNFKAA
jgi:hypothetical protein